MPGMKGTEFLRAARKISPDTVRIMLTGFAEFDAAIDAINEGGVYKFLMKPYKRNVIFEAVQRHSVVQSLKKADEYSLYSLAQTIELKDAYTKGHCDQVAKYALLIADALNIDDRLKDLIRKGSWLHDCGKIGVPENILNFPGPLSSEQMAAIKKHSCWGADVAPFNKGKTAVQWQIKSRHFHETDHSHGSGVLVVRVHNV
jgi:putative two-component system response regulator